MVSKNKKIHGVIHAASATAAGVGAGLAQIPGSDAPILCSIQTAMIISLGEIHGRKITQKAAIALIAEFMATMAGRTLSQWLVGWIPGYGNAINASTAASVTEAVGWAANAFFEDSPQESKSAA